MKNIFRFLALLSFVVLMASCEKDHKATPFQSDFQNSFKADDDDDIIYVSPPTIHGQVFLTSQQLSQGVAITFTGVNVSYFDSTTPDENGNFTFYNVISGDYIRSTIVNGVTINTIDYIVN